MISNARRRTRKTDKITRRSCLYECSKGYWYEIFKTAPELELLEDKQKKGNTWNSTNKAEIYNKELDKAYCEKTKKGY